MSQTAQQKAIQWALNAIAFCNQQIAAADTIDALLREYNDEGMGAIFNAMQTAPKNTDGSISNTPDGTPNNANPIIVSALSRAANDIANIAFSLGQHQKFFNNQAVSTGPYRQTYEQFADNV